MERRKGSSKKRGILAALAVGLVCLVPDGPGPGEAQAAPGASPARFDPFDWGLNLPERAVSRRISRHFFFGGPEPEVLAELKGPGCIRRFWITVQNPEEVILRIYFDGEEIPYVEAPLTTFFGVMHLTGGPRDVYRVDTPFFSIKEKNGMTCYLPMPFAESARIEVIRQGGMKGDREEVNLHYMIDWHQYVGQELEEPMRFSARWRREAPVKDWSDEFLMLDAEGPGRLIGYFLGVDMLESRFTHRWSHAGGDSVYIDGEGDYPSYLRGVGGEDTFGTSYSGGEYGLLFETQTSMWADKPYYIQAHEETRDTRGGSERQRLVGYRFFVNDSITFERSLHLRFGAREHDYQAMVYWYAASPVRPFFDMPPPEQRGLGTEVRRGEYDRPLPDTGEWWIAGPFDRDFSELPEGAIDFEEEFNGRPWQRYSAIRNFVDFNHVYRGKPAHVSLWTLEGSAVARATITAPEETTAEFLVAWDDEMILQVNGQEPVDLGYNLFLEGRRLEVPLRAGENDVVLLLRNARDRSRRQPSFTRGSWIFSLRVTTETGEVLLPAAPVSGE